MTKDKIYYEVLLFLAGLFGSLTFIGKKGVKSFKSGMLSVFIGVNVAYWLTPLFISIPFLADWGVVTNHKTDYAVSFLLGATGWAVIEFLQSKAIKKSETNNDDNHGDN